MIFNFNHHENRQEGPHSSHGTKQAHPKIDQLIEIVQNGGSVKTGVDVYSKDTILLLDKDVLIKTVKPLLIIKQNGIEELPINPNNIDGLWDHRSEGSIVIPFTDDKAEPLRSKVDPINLADTTHIESGLNVNDEKPLLSPVEAYRLLPDYLKESVAA